MSFPAPFPPVAPSEQIILSHVPNVGQGDGTGDFFGALVRLVRNTPALYAIFGDRVHPGQAPPGTAMPHVVLTVLSASSNFENHRTEVADNGDHVKVIYLNLWQTLCQISTYAVGYETAKSFSKRLHDKIDKHPLRIDCHTVIPYVRDMVVTLDPKRSEDGREVWQFGYRYEVPIPEFMLANS